MADNTRNDGKSGDRRNAGKRSGGGQGNKGGSRAQQQPKAEAKEAKQSQSQSKPKPRREERQSPRPSRLDMANRSWALGAAAVGTAVLAGLAYAAWQHHAEIADAFEEFFDDDDDADEGIAVGSANMEGASFATNGTTPTTQRKARAARDVPPSDDERDAFAPATVPVGATEATDSPATA